MGTFAVLGNLEGRSFQVDECHLNLWSLGGWFGRRILYFDVGILFKPEVDAVSNISVLVPFPVDIPPKDARPQGPAAWANLGGRLTNDETGRLVFGEPVATVNQHQVRLASGKEFLIANVLRCGRASEPSDGATQAEMSIWNITFDPIPAGRLAYLRVRFRAATGGRTWVWGRSKRTAVVDLRVNELRESASASPEVTRSLEKRFKRIEKLNALVIAPAWLESHVVSPETRYVRLFEGRVWEPYLGRVVDLRRSDKLLIYHWKKTGIPGDGTDPFRGLLSLAAEPKWPGWFVPTITAFLTAALVLGATSAQGIIPQITWPQLTVTGAVFVALAVIDRLRSNFSFLKSLPSGLRRGLLALEDSVYRMRT